MINRKFETLTEKIDFISFRQHLLFDNDEVSRILFENEVNEKEFRTIMDLLDSYREKLARHEPVSHSQFESEVYAIIPHLEGNYHFCEMLTKAFCDDGRWEEVFPALYGGLAKYKKWDV